MRMKLVGANHASDAEGIDERPGKSHYLIGADPKKWQTDIATYSRVKYKDIYPGVDMLYYGNQQRLEYDFIVAPGANPKAITLAYTGVRKIGLDAKGDLVLQTAFGEIRQHKPVVYPNGGKKWPEANLQATITALAIDPKDPATLYASGSTLERNRDGAQNRGKEVF